MNKVNLRKLAKYLDTVSVDSFDMSDFMQDWEGISLTVQDHECGTAACAVGHGPAAGMPVIPEDMDWYGYSGRVFGLDFQETNWDWCFSGCWTNTDNTPQGTAKRIRYLLKNGSPPDGYYQGLEDEFVSAYQ